METPHSRFCLENFLPRGACGSVHGVAKSLNMTEQTTQYNGHLRKISVCDPGKLVSIFETQLALYKMKAQMSHTRSVLKFSSLFSDWLEEHIYCCNNCLSTKLSLSLDASTKNAYALMFLLLKLMVMLI